MKKTLLFSIVLCFVLSGLLPAATVADDFESYAPGLVADVTGGNWVEFGPAGYAVIKADPIDSGQVLGVTEKPQPPNNGEGVYGVLSGGAIIASGQTKTLYLRILTNDVTCNTAFGLTDVDVVPANSWASFGTFLRIGAGGIVARQGAANVYSPGYVVAADTWYNVWVVVNHTANTFDLYATAGGNDATAVDLLADDYPFRLSNTNDLDRFITMGLDASALGTKEVLFDNITVTDGVDTTIPANINPYGPVVIQGTPSGTNIPTTLTWKAGKDPLDVYAVNPDIVDEFVFLSNSGEPNLVYLGATGIDPGTDDPNSAYPPITGIMDSTYHWVVVEELVGNTQTFSVGDPFSSVDPNDKIVGSVWSYESTKSIAQITVQPEDARVFTTDPTASFTVDYTCISVPTAVWYKNGVALTNGGDVTITTTGTFSTLSIATPVLTDEAKYYCILSVAPGTVDDVQTATRLLVIKKELAQFNFENVLTDSSGNGAPTGVVKTVSLVEPISESSATVVPSPTYVAGVGGGQAISLDGTQFVDFGTGGYPKAGPLDTIGDIRGVEWEKQGFGHGMDEGSMLCWVKLASDGAVYSNANNNFAPATDATHFAMTTDAIVNARIVLRGTNWDDSTQFTGEANGAYLMDGFDLQDGQWHMFAATWNNSSNVRVYINGEEVAAGVGGYTEVYKPWELSNLLGTSRALDRSILNAADFVTGAIDKLRVYNYVIEDADIAQEYETISGNIPCLNHAFVGSAFNFDNTAVSYCKVDLYDFADFAAAWLADGYVAPAP